MIFPHPFRRIELEPEAGPNQREPPRVIQQAQRSGHGVCDGSGLLLALLPFASFDIGLHGETFRVKAQLFKWLKSYMSSCDRSEFGEAVRLIF